MQSCLMAGLPLQLFPALALGRVAKGGGRGHPPSDPSSHPRPAWVWDPDSYLWRLAGRGALWAWGSPGLRAPPPPV